MFVNERIEGLAGGCQVMSKHLTETSMRGVFFHDEQPASAAHTGNKFIGHVGDRQLGYEPYLGAHVFL